MRVTQAQYSMLYAVYSMPNIILPVFVGLIVSKCGADSVLLFMCALSVTGCLVVASGGY